MDRFSAWVAGPRLDEVARYRQYDEDGTERLGEYGRVFEEEYAAAFNGQRTMP
ncbi:hypothetical protein AGMMS49925_05130 [Deltaproteobacteria bacterium]|nr:hypothetical protein AGMMS49925_05130 [Deltaproteobacteria bacterium]